MKWCLREFFQEAVKGLATRIGVYSFGKSLPVGVDFSMSGVEMIDAHHHLWKYMPQDFPWIPEGGALAQSYGLVELHEVTARSGVTVTVVVQARQFVDETRWLLDLAARSLVIRGVVGWLPLIEDAVVAQLIHWQHEEALKGLRHVLQEEPDEYFARSYFHRGVAARGFLGSVEKFLGGWIFGVLGAVLAFVRRFLAKIAFVWVNLVSVFEIDSENNEFFHNVE